MAAFETIITEQEEVSCEGGGGPLGHPRVWLHIRSENDNVTCPYCSRTYMLKEAADRASQLPRRQLADRA